MSFYQAAAVILLLVFYGSYYAKKISQKKKGIQTTQIGRGKTGFHRAVEVVMGIFSIWVVMAEAASIALDWSLSPGWLRIAGVAAALLGNISFITGMLTMRDSWRAGVSEDKTELVTEGIFRISRNPAFLGFDLVYLGILLLFFNGLLCFLSLSAMLMLHLQIVYNEEEAMLRAFGDEYQSYQGKVNRYLGRKR